MKMTYSRTFLLSLCYWWKPSTSCFDELQSSRHCITHKPISPTVWNDLKSAGILKPFRGTRRKNCDTKMNPIRPITTSNRFLNNFTPNFKRGGANQNNLLNIHLLEDELNHSSTHCIDNVTEAENNNNRTETVTSIKRHFVPSIMLSNVMSLAPKIDEVRELMLRNKINIGLFTETWLKERIPDSIIDIPGYDILRKDRVEKEHGGVCAYVQNSIKYSVLKDLQCCCEHEILWFKINPPRLPRNVTSIITAVVYHPPGADKSSIKNHLFQSLATAESLYPNCGLLIAGDFNRLDVSSIRRHFRLKQLVKAPTRGQAVLDLILTNLHDHYLPIEMAPPFGLSDHSTIMVKPKIRSPGNSTRKTILTRDIRPSRKQALGRYLNNVDWSAVSCANDCESKLQTFTNFIKIGMDTIIPERPKRIIPSDAPWMSSKLKDLILLRQRAFHKDRTSITFKFYRNAVNRERKKCKFYYYANNVQQLKDAKPHQWWKEVNRLCGSVQSKESQLVHKLHVPEFHDKSELEIADAINHAFLEPLQSFQQLNTHDCLLAVEEDHQPLLVSPHKVHNVLHNLNTRKAPGPDNIPNWILKEYADILCIPIAEILNASFKEQTLPSIWKKANVVPLPKVKQVKDPKKDLRPISLTPAISKIAEEFVVTDYIKPAVLKINDKNQYGTIPGSSTVMALISMFHNWLEQTDSTGSDVRVLLFDFRKAFDFIDHTKLVNKLKQISIPNGVVNWIINFLSGRTQRVKLSHDCLSEWGEVPCGVPQGTKLGPWLFLIMISDLDISSNTFKTWKYVDDTTISEVIDRGNSSEAQLAVNAVSSWSRDNLFQLNIDKCKELRISFKKNERPSWADVNINDTPITNVEKAKLLGVTINNKLTWNDHIQDVIKKAATRLYFLVQLKRSSVLTDDIIAYYRACICSVMDYACPIFHYSLPKYLQCDLERIQRRAMAIIYPNSSYKEALQLSGLSTVNDRQNQLTKNLFKQIIQDSENRICDLVPHRNESTVNTRKKRTFRVPVTKTNRYMNSFMISSAINFDKV